MQNQEKHGNIKRSARRKAGIHLEVQEDSILQYGILQREMNHQEEAEKALQEALAICLSLVQENPELYENQLVSVYDNLRIVWKDSKPEKAEEVLRKALGIYERLALAHPKVYGPEKARVCFDLARLMARLGEDEEAERLYEKVWVIYHNLAKISTEAWYPYLSSASFNLYLVKRRMWKWEEAETYCRAALEADRGLTQVNPSIYWNYPAESGCELVGLLCRGTEESQEAKDLYLEALDRYGNHQGQEKEIQRIEDILRTRFGMN